MKADEVIARAQELLQEKVLEAKAEGDLPYIRVKAEDLTRTLFMLKEDEELHLNWLEWLTFVDYPEKNELEGLYLLYSLDKRHKLMVKININRQKPKLDSLALLWWGASWHENEAYDLFGVTFEGHPDPRRLLTHQGIGGYPLRKDFRSAEMLSAEEEHKKAKPTAKPDSKMRAKKG
jgi:NADH:ubiquinone oxidoreductase subunit C